MNIVLLTIKEPHMTFGNIGLEIISANLKAAGHEVHAMVETIMDPSSRITSSEQKNLDKLSVIKPYFLGIYVTTMRYQWCLKFSRLVKAHFSNIKIIFGGPHTTALPELVIEESCVDILCVGEGEAAIVELLSAPGATNIRNLWFKANGTLIKNPLRPLVQDLDSVPFADRKMWLECVDRGEFKRYLITVSRGCPYTCTYCFTSSLRTMYEGLGQFVRHRSPENVIRELITAKHEFNINWVVFMDDNLALRKPWFLEFSKLYAEHVNVPYACNTHLFTIDLERAQALKDSNCKFIMLGLQSGSEYVRGLLNRSETNDNVRETARICKEVGLKFTIDHIFGLTEDEAPYLMESARLYNEVRPNQVNTFFLYLFPRTPILDMKNLSESDLNLVNQGKYQSPTFRSTRDPHYINYRNLFVSLPFLPRGIVTWVLDNDKVHWFNRVPESMIWVMKAISNLRMGNTPSIIAHLKFLPRKLLERLRGFKGEFD